MELSPPEPTDPEITWDYFYFPDDAPGISNIIQNQSSGLNFGSFWNQDLFLTFGRATLNSNLSIRELIYVKKHEVGVGWTYYILSIGYDGIMSDLYDFDFFSELPSLQLAKNGAIVQIGKNSYLGRPYGQIFKSTIYLHRLINYPEQSVRNAYGLEWTISE